MAVTEDDIRAFTEFARRRAENGGAELRLSELAHQWEAQREHEETLAEATESLADMEAGAGRTVQGFDDEMRAKHGIPK